MYLRPVNMETRCPDNGQGENTQCPLGPIYFCCVNMCSEQDEISTTITRRYLFYIFSTRDQSNVVKIKKYKNWVMTLFFLGLMLCSALQSMRLTIFPIAWMTVKKTPCSLCHIEIHIQQLLTDCCYIVAVHGMWAALARIHSFSFEASWHNG